MLKTEYATESPMKPSTKITPEQKIAQADRLHRSGRLEEAAALYVELLQSGETRPDIFHKLGKIAHDIGNHQGAVDMIGLANQQEPDNPVYYVDLGVVYSALGDMQRAQKAYECAIRCQPDHPQALNNLGLIFFDTGRYDEARSLFESLIKIHPGFSNAYYNLGLIYYILGKPEAAIRAFDISLRLKPDSREIRLNRGLALLSTGAYAEGWAEYEYRFASKEITAPVHPGSGSLPIRWQGERFIGRRLFVHDEQGLGDTLQFIRYLPLAKALGGEVIFETKTTLVSLLQNFDGIDRLIPRPCSPSEIADCDFFIPIMSLPHVMGTTLSTVPANVPYIKADPEKSARWSQKLLGDAFKVGLVWAGRPTRDYLQNRSAGMERVGLRWAGNPLSHTAAMRPDRLDHFSPLGDLPGIQWYGLQKGDAARQADDPPGDMAIVNLNEHLKDFTDTAAIINNMDLIISVDTAVAHLAGMMAAPVWVVLSSVCDWRWMRDRTDSPWYPTMRLFRQQPGEKWQSVTRRIADALEKMIHATA